MAGIKITFISTMQGFPWGGSEELWFNIALLALEKNYEIQVCTHDWISLPLKINQLKDKGANIVTRKESENNILNKIYRNLKINKIPKFITLISQFNPDVILISQGATFDFFQHQVLYNLIMKLNKPYFLISQFNVEHGDLQSPLIRNKVINPNKKWNKFYFVSERNLLAANKQIANNLINTEIISNPVNLKTIKVCDWPKDKILQIACVARYDINYKGQDILLNALSAFKDANFKIDFYGSGPDEDALKELIKYYQLENIAFVNKYVSDVDEIWERHHILILPSISEGTPLSLQEAMLKGRPAFVTNVGGNSTLIIDGETGFLAEFPNITCIRMKLATLFDTSLEDLKVMGEKANTKALSTINFHSAENILKDIINA